ncbi:hypothetical protein BURKHO8Y_350008 [Burkholderia sp. 8Y]|nr:hypothetical protein BURKHO8Y_350008 [Burkholderia sp. 8Y]
MRRLSYLLTPLNRLLEYCLIQPNASSQAAESAKGHVAWHAVASAMAVTNNRHGLMKFVILGRYREACVWHVYGRFRQILRSASGQEDRFIDSVMRYSLTPVRESPQTDMQPTYRDRRTSDTPICAGCASGVLRTEPAVRVAALQLRRAAETGRLPKIAIGPMPEYRRCARALADARVQRGYWGELTACAVR